VSKDVYSEELSEFDETLVSEFMSVLEEMEIKLV
jgi:hypothetical protein